jgi:hypothetical protein
VCCRGKRGAAIWERGRAGTTHVATEKLDERYELLYKGPSTADRIEAPTADADLDAWKRTPHVQRLLADPRVASYDKLIAQHAKAQGVDPALVKAVVAVESAFIADAVSNKGALGLMQVIPQTAMRYGVAADGKRSVEQKLLGSAHQRRHRHALPARPAGDVRGDCRSRSPLTTRASRRWSTTSGAFRCILRRRNS